MGGGIGPFYFIYPIYRERLLGLLDMLPYLWLALVTVLKMSPSALIYLLGRLLLS